MKISAQTESLWWAKYFAMRLGAILLILMGVLATNTACKSINQTRETGEGQQETVSFLVVEACNTFYVNEKGQYVKKDKANTKDGDVKVVERFIRLVITPANATIDPNVEVRFLSSPSHIQVEPDYVTRFKKNEERDLHGVKTTFGEIQNAMVADENTGYSLITKPDDTNVTVYAQFKMIGADDKDTVQAGFPSKECVFK